MGKLRSNFMGTEFTMYDDGQDPEVLDDTSVDISESSIRQELGVVFYVIQAQSMRSFVTHVCFARNRTSWALGARERWKLSYRKWILKENRKNGDLSPKTTLSRLRIREARRTHCFASRTNLRNGTIVGTMGQCLPDPITLVS
jgi:hypothetical protein